MEIFEVLNEFATFTKYDNEQKKFNLLSSNYAFHRAGKDIEMLLSGYDPSGALSAMRAREAFMDVTRNVKIPVYGWLTNPQIKKEIQEYAEMWGKLNDPEILAKEDAYINEMNQMVEKTIGIPMIGKREMEQERSQFMHSVIKVVEDLKKMQLDCYQSSKKPVNEIKKFHTRILVFERMGDCILHLSKESDAIYLCYISQHQSADGYFAFVLKNNGNIVAFHDRINEAFIGEHKNARNGRWTDAHMDRLFPYESVLRFKDHDYKGYAQTYIIDEEKLDFLKLGVDAYQPLLIAMIILKNKYEGISFESEPLFLNTFMKPNLLATKVGKNELAEIQKNEIALRSIQYTCTLDPKIIVTENGYNERFGMNTHSVPWVELYGEKFIPDLEAALASFENEQDTSPMSEFIGNQERMDKEVYYEIRKQLADYIKNQMKREIDEHYNEPGAIEDYWIDRAIKKKNKFIDLICKKVYQTAHPEEKWEKDMECIDGIRQKDNGVIPRKRMCNNDVGSNTAGWIYRTNEVLDDYNGAKCSIFYWFEPKDCKTMEIFLEEPMPKIFQGFGVNHYNGNSLISAVDMVGELESPILEHFRRYSLCIGFSKTGWKHTYYTWLREHDFEAEIERLEFQKKKNKNEKKRNRKQN